MNHTLINNHLHISFPDEFQFLTRDELQELYRSDNKDMWGIRDKAHKILLTVFHHKSSGFMVKVFGNPKEIAEQNERKLAAFYRDYGYERRDNTDFIVTSGISDWELWFKTGVHSEYVIIDVT